ncbi:hypothetical protein V9T40_000231 [Parthenolecanium corni]|uniref:Uncharacterized protein n=1 Tax=Parthenolecanium corni TaxID=536013 RepID=A0AAN9T955_9HEMI
MVYEARRGEAKQSKAKRSKAKQSKAKQSKSSKEVITVECAVDRGQISDAMRCDAMRCDATAVVCLASPRLASISVLALGWRRLRLNAPLFRALNPHLLFSAARIDFLCCAIAFFAQSHSQPAGKVAERIAALLQSALPLKLAARSSQRTAHSYALIKGGFTTAERVESSRVASRLSVAAVMEMEMENGGWMDEMNVQIEDDDDDDDDDDNDDGDGDGDGDDDDDDDDDDERDVEMVDVRKG